MWPGAYRLARQGRFTDTRSPSSFQIRATRERRLVGALGSELSLGDQHFERDMRKISDVATENQLALLRARFSLDRERDTVVHLQAQQQVLRQQSAQDRVQRNLALVGAVLLIVLSIVAGKAWRRRLAAEVAQRSAEQRLEDLGRLAAGIAHDFNNLMTVVQQAAGQLARNSTITADPQARSLIDAAQGAARTGGEITRQLLAFGRQQMLRPQLLRLDEYFARVTNLLQQTAGPSITIEMQVRPGLVLSVDPSQLTSALVNLVVNARDAMGGRGRIRIDASVQTLAASAREVTSISVHDDGPGMTPEVLVRATEPFFSTKEAGTASGLGLSAVDGFVHQSGGKFEIRSAPGAGAGAAHRPRLRRNLRTVL